jgi:hypothetical protein
LPLSVAKEESTTASSDEENDDAEDEEEEEEEQKQKAKPTQAPPAKRPRKAAPADPSLERLTSSLSQVAEAFAASRRPPVSTSVSPPNSEKGKFPPRFLFFAVSTTLMR